MLIALHNLNKTWRCLMNTQFNYYCSKSLYFLTQIYQRGLTEEMSKYVLFMHSESSHSLPTQPTETILALNES